MSFSVVCDMDEKMRNKIKINLASWVIMDFSRMFNVCGVDVCGVVPKVLKMDHTPSVIHAFLFIRKWFIRKYF